MTLTGPTEGVLYLESGQVGDQIDSHLHVMNLEISTNYILYVWQEGARGSIDGCGIMLQAGRSLVRVPMWLLNFFSICLILLAAPGLGV
jgi:hypothetical protein